MTNTTQNRNRQIREFKTAAARNVDGEMILPARHRVGASTGFCCSLERCSSVVERQTRNRVTPGFKSPLLLILSLGIFVLSTTPQLTQLYK